MTKAKTFALAWIDAVATSTVSTSAKAVALAMVTHADYATGHNMRAGHARLAAMSGLSERQVRRVVGELRDAQLIAWDGIPTVPGRARNYQLTIPNTGHGCPVYNDERRSPVSGVPTGTAAIHDRNAGHPWPPTRALPGLYQRALQAHPLVRPPATRIHSTRTATPERA